MDIFFNVLRVTLEEGFMYAVLALGIYITYSILDFPDLSVDGTVPLGAVTTGILIVQGINPWVCCLISFMLGMAAGCITGLLNVKLKIRPLLCGILVMTALLSINLVIVKSGTDGLSIVSFFTSPTIFSSGPAEIIPVSVGGFALRTVVISFIVALLCKILLDVFLKTKTGLLLRAAGSNHRYVTMLGRDPGNMKILGLSIGNGLAAFSGSVIAQQKGSADLQMGTGMVVAGLACVIIGLSLFGKLKFVKATSAVILGSVIYKACLSAALALGLPTEYLKLLMAVLFTAALVASSSLSKNKGGEIYAGA